MVGMRRIGSVIFCTVLIAWVAVGAAPDGMHPKAPEETEQFAFLIGTWDCKTKFIRAIWLPYASSMPPFVIAAPKALLLLVIWCSRRLV